MTPRRFLLLVALVLGVALVLTLAAPADPEPMSVDIGTPAVEGR